MGPYMLASWLARAAAAYRSVTQAYTLTNHMISICTTDHQCRVAVTAGELPAHGSSCGQRGRAREMCIGRVAGQGPRGQAYTRISQVRTGTVTL